MRHEPDLSSSERYLRQATRGLWGRKQREVREELEAHLHERVMAHRIAGLGEADALERALAELGAPHHVQSGMLRLYVLPTVAGSGMAVAAACALVIALLPKGVAQEPVSGTFYWPSTACTAALRSDSILRAYEACEVFDNSLWLDTRALVSTFEAQGVTVEKGEEQLTFTFPGAAPVDVPAGNAASPTISVEGRTVAAAPDALALWNLVRAVSEQSELPVSFAGWDNPVVTIGDASFRLGTQVRPVSGDDFYDNYLEQVLFRSLLEPAMREGDSISVFVLNRRRDTGAPLQETSLRVANLEPGVYGVAVLLDPGMLTGFLPSDAKPVDFNVALEVVRVEEGERLTVHLPEGNVRFVEAFAAEPRAGSAVLVKLEGVPAGGRSWFDIIAPARVDVQAAN